MRTSQLKGTRLLECELDSDVSLPAECTEYNTELSSCIVSSDAWKMRFISNLSRKISACAVCEDCKGWCVALTLKSGSRLPLGLK